MAWVYLDDQFPDHPKVAAAGGDAAWLFVCALAYCRRYNTDGAIPRAQVSRLSDRKSPTKLAAKLVEVRLWDVTDDGYVIHDYSDWNRPTESKSKAGQKAANARWDKARAEKAEDAKRNADASDSHSERIAQADAKGCTIPIPVPIPTGVDTSTDGLKTEARKPRSSEAERRARMLTARVRGEAVNRYGRGAKAEELTGIAAGDLPRLVTEYPTAPDSMLIGKCLGDPVPYLAAHRAEVTA